MEDLLDILTNTTVLTKDVDLFAYDIGLGRSGAWVSEVQTPSVFNGTGYQEYDLFYRSKDKEQCMANIKYLKEAIDGLRGSNGVCMIPNGTTFKLEMLFTWDFLEKDAEGYFVWANRLGLIVD